MVDLRIRDLLREAYLAGKNRQAGASRRIASGSDGRDRRDRHLVKTALSAALRAGLSHRIGPDQTLVKKIAIGAIGMVNSEC